MPRTRYVAFALLIRTSLIDKLRFTLFSSTKTQRLENTKRNISRAPHQPRLLKGLPTSIRSSFTKTMSSKSRSTASQARKATFSRTSRHLSTRTKKLTIPKTPSLKTGLMRLGFPIQKLPSLKIGMKTLRMRSSTRKQLSPMTGSRTSLP